MRHCVTRQALLDAVAIHRDGDLLWIHSACVDDVARLSAELRRESVRAAGSRASHDVEWWEAFHLPEAASRQQAIAAS